MRKLLMLLVVAGLIGLAIFWFVTQPKPLGAEALAGTTSDVEAGKYAFYAAGCSSCHAAPDAEGEEKLKLAGGKRFVSDFGTFIAPNISPDPEHGIGGWSDLELVNAVVKGVTPGGSHYFPAFPYTSYGRAEVADVANIAAFLRTLPPVTQSAAPHEVGFPFNIRRSLGGWKFLFLDDGWQIEGDLTEQQTRGRYLAEALGHCGECHTPRNFLGATDGSRWLGGAKNPSGKGRIPNITPAVLKWSEADMAEYLKSGFTPEFNSSGGEMVDVIANTSQLTDEDRAAIAAYLKVVPGVADPATQ